MLLHDPLVVSVVGSTVDMRLVVIMEILMQVLRIWRMRNALVDIAGPGGVAIPPIRDAM